MNRDDSKEGILTRGYLDAHVRVGGIRQTHRFIVQKEKTGFGELDFLVTKGNVPQSELARLAEEHKMPAKSPLGTAFPKNNLKQL